MVGQNLNDLTDEEILWCRVQIAIDEGFGACKHCHKIGFGPYCRSCGKLMAEIPEEERIGECRACRAGGRIVIVTDRFCNVCGTPTEDTEFWQSLKQGQLSYDALNEQSRGKMSPAEIEMIENYFGEAIWDENGRPLKQYEKKNA
jgi:hypothetical protein